MQQSTLRRSSLLPLAVLEQGNVADAVAKMHHGEQSVTESSVAIDRLTGRWQHCSSLTHQEP